MLGLSKQEIFNRVYIHLLTQRRRSFAGNTCRYRARPFGHPAQCAIGCLIPDRLYHPAMEGLGLTALFKDYKELKIRESSIDFLYALQLIHDRRAVDDWEDALNEFRVDYKLKPVYFYKQLNDDLTSPISVNKVQYKVGEWVKPNIKGSLLYVWHLEKHNIPPCTLYRCEVKGLRRPLFIENDLRGDVVRDFWRLKRNKKKIPQSFLVNTADNRPGLMAAEQVKLVEKVKGI